MRGSKVLDFHVHAFADKIAQRATENLVNYYKMPAVSNGTFDIALKKAKEANINKMVIHVVATKANQVEEINNHVKETMDTAPDMLIGFGTIHRDYDNYKSELKRIKDLGLRGIKLHNEFQGFDIDDDKMMPVYEEIVKLDLPILFHMGDKNGHRSSPKRLAKVLDKIPEMRAIAAHMGGVFMWDYAEEYLVGRDLYFDTSSSLFKIGDERFIKMLRAHGADRVFFGTDYPLSDYDLEFSYFDRLNLTKEETELIFYKNAYNFLGIEDK